MGQRDSIRGTDDPFLLGLDRDKPKNGQAVVKKQKQPAVVEQDDPFLFGLKKKESAAASEDTGIPSPTGTENIAPSQLPSTSGAFVSRFQDKSIFAPPAKETIFEKSFLDRDIERPQELDLTNPELTRSKNKYSLRNLYTDAAQQRFDEEKEAEKFNIKKNIVGLAEYNRKRIAEINADIKKDTDELNNLHIESGRRIGTLPAEGISEKHTQLVTDIAAANYYKSEFKKSIAKEAAKKIVPAFVNSETPFNPRQLGREVVRIADPEYDVLLREAESGKTLPGITQANLERVGIDLAQDYLRNIPQTPEVEQKIAEVQGYEDDFDSRNIELTAQRAREKIGIYLYSKGNSNAGGFWGNSQQDIMQAVNDPVSGLTESEKKVAVDYILPIERKLIFSTDIPGSGFFRAGKNAIERSLLNTYNTLSGKFGDRDDADRAFDLLNEDVGGSQFRAPGENPTWKAELNSLERKESKEKLSPEEQLRKTELEKYVDVRSGWSSFKDGTGDLTGQVLEIALLTKGIGLAGRALKAIGSTGGLATSLTSSAAGSALSNETVGLFLSGYLNSYDTYRQQALTMMPGKENAANRDAYAKTMAAFEGLSERIFRDTKVLKAFTKSIAPSVADITSRFINKEITQQLAREEFRKTLMQKLKPFGKELGESIYQESTEEGIVELADGMAQSVFGGQPFDLIETGQKAVNTFLTTALHSGVVSGLAARGKVQQQRSQNAYMKSAIVDMAKNPAPYYKSAEDLLISGQITQQEFNEKISLIKSAQKYLHELPESVKSVQTIHGKSEIIEKQMDYPEAASYVIHRMNEGIINDKLGKTPSGELKITDEIQRKDLEADLKRSIEIRKGIHDNTIGVTPDLQEVAGDEKKAADLNVLDANVVPDEELIGTPFYNIKTKTNEKNVTQEGGLQAEEKSSSQEKDAGEKRDVADTKGAVSTTAPLFRTPEQADQLLNEKLPKEKKYNEVEVTDILTGRAPANKINPNKPISARAAADAMKKRFDTLQKLIDCIK